MHEAAVPACNNMPRPHVIRYTVCAFAKGSYDRWLIPSLNLRVRDSNGSHYR